tara:strand:+ start:2819 stop:3061 length:243 start_codon:yes stop_codon:yes gene_type:complete
MQQFSSPDEFFNAMKKDIYQDLEAMDYGTFESDDCLLTEPKRHGISYISEIDINIDSVKHIPNTQLIHFSVLPRCEISYN